MYISKKCIPIDISILYSYIYTILIWVSLKIRCSKQRWFSETSELFTFLVYGAGGAPSMNSTLSTNSDPLADIPWQLGGKVGGCEEIKI